MEAIILGYVPAFLRLLGFLTLVPPGFELLGIGRRVALAAGGALLLATPAAEASSGPDLLFEWLAGVAVGIPAALVCELSSWCGELFDAARGDTIGAILEPASGTHHPACGALLGQLVWGWLAVSGLLTTCVIALHRSFLVVPPGEVLREGAAVVGERLLLVAAELGAVLLFLLLPLAAVLLVVDLLGGLLARVVPGLGLPGELFLIKSALGGLLLLGSLGWSPAQSLRALAEPLVGRILTGGAGDVG